MLFVFCYLVDRLLILAFQYLKSNTVQSCILDYVDRLMNDIFMGEPVMIEQLQEVPPPLRSIYINIPRKPQPEISIEADLTRSRLHVPNITFRFRWLHHL